MNSTSLMDYLLDGDACFSNTISAPMEFVYHIVKYVQNETWVLRKHIDYSAVSILNNTLSYHGGSTSLTNRTMLMKYYYHHHMWLLNHLVLVQISPASTLSIYSLKIFMKK